MSCTTIVSGQARSKTSNVDQTVVLGCMTIDCAEEEVLARHQIPIYLSIILSIYLYIILYLYLSIILSIIIYHYLSISIYLSIYPSIYLSICLSVYLSIYLFLMIHWLDSMTGYFICGPQKHTTELRSIHAKAPLIMRHFLHQDSPEWDSNFMIKHIPCLWVYYSSASN